MRGEGENGVVKKLKMSLPGCAIADPALAKEGESMGSVRGGNETGS